MQKVLRINLIARNTALKNARKQKLKDIRKEWREHDQARIVLDKDVRQLIKNERRARREDWAAGPLASQRDVGNKESVYGAGPASLLRAPKFPSSVVRGPKGNGWDPVGSEGLKGENKEWEGEGNEGNIVVGDRVCVVQGKESLIGQIGRVKELQADRRSVSVENINMVSLLSSKPSPFREKDAHVLT